MSFESALAQSGEPIVGINLGHAQTDTIEQQTTLLNELKTAGVHVIRAAIGPDDKGLDLVKRIYAQGIRILWILPLKYPANVPVRPWRPKEFPGMWAGPPLSLSDPDQFRTYFAPLLAKLEVMNIKLAGFELGNELNMTAFNGEFPVPGEGKQFGLNDLYHDPEAEQIAKGYLQYLKVLAVLKDIRDHSKANQHTPIMTAGFGAYEAPEGPFPPPAKPGTQTDMASVNATLDFMRANGLDKLVDAYAVHVYPWANAPGDPAAAAGRRSRLAKYVLAECRSAGSSDGKPCWVTEWGFKNHDTSCPVHEADQVTLIEEMRNGFSQYAEQGSLAGLLYYAWIDTAENFGVFRCGALTQSGRLAVAPIDQITQFCKACLRIRVGLPRVVRGPAADIADNRFTEFQLPNGRFRGFDAHGETRAIDGDHPWDMGGGARVVLSRGKPGAYDSCGQWIQHVELAGKTLLGFVHDETACRYQAGQTHKSMSFAVSTDYGLTWKDQGQIITGTDSPTASKNTGEGDCTFLNGQDGYYYGYCGRPRDGAVIVARAPVSRLGPGNWMKFFQGQWDQPGLGGDARSLGKGLGTSAARWTSNGETVLLGWVRAGMGLFFSSDHTTFTPLAEPMLDLDPGIWRRPDPSEVYAYPVMLDAKTGGNQLSNSWMLVYAYWPPYQGGAQQ